MDKYSCWDSYVSLLVNSYTERDGMFNHLKLKIKLIVLLIPLLLGLLIYSMVLLNDRWHQQHDAALVVERMHLLKEASNLVHELQKERGMTSGFLASKGLKFSDALKVQREKSENQLNSTNT